MPNGAIIRKRKNRVNEDWEANVHRGNCYNKPDKTHLFFPEQGRLSEHHAAMIMCWGNGDDIPECPIRQLCLDTHLNETHGVWGGTSENQRKKLRRGESLKLKETLRCQRCFYMKCRCAEQQSA